MNVLFFQPFGGVGHLDSWASLTVAAVLDSGGKATVVAPQTTCKALNIHFEGPTSRSALFTIPLDTGATSPWRLFWFLASLMLSVKSLISGKLDWRASPLTVLKANQLARRSLDASIDVIFLPYLDGFNTRKGEWKLLRRLLPIPLVGIRFVGSAERRTELHESVDAVALLDERLVDQCNKDLRAPRYVFLPDISPISTKHSDSDLYQQIRRFSSGRKIVLLIGAINSRKSPRLWCDVIDAGDPKEWAFVQVGKVEWRSLGGNSAQRLRDTHLAHPESFLLIDEYVSDVNFHLVFELADAVFAVYDNFSESSNLIFHSAYHRKPVLVANSGLMATRVQQFGLGLLCQDTNPKAVLQQLSRMIKQGVSADGVRHYQETFNESEFKKAISQLVSIAVNKK